MFGKYRDIFTHDHNGVSGLHKAFKGAIEGGVEGVNECIEMINEPEGLWKIPFIILAPFFLTFDVAIGMFEWGEELRMHHDIMEVNRDLAKQGWKRNPDPL